MIIPSSFLLFSPGFTDIHVSIQISYQVYFKRKLLYISSFTQYFTLSLSQGLIKTHQLVSTPPTHTLSPSFSSSLVPQVAQLTSTLVSSSICLLVSSHNQNHYWIQMFFPCKWLGTVILTTSVALLQLTYSLLLVVLLGHLLYQLSNHL